MGRPRKPSNVLELSGAFKQHPSRRRTGVKAPDRSIGAPPEHFDDHQRAAWAELVRDAPPGVLKASDQVALALAASLMAEFRQAPYAFTAAKHSNLLKLLQQFAMTPSSRENFSLKVHDEICDELREFL